MLNSSAASMLALALWYAWIDGTDFDRAKRAASAAVICTPGSLVCWTELAAIVEAATKQGQALLGEAIKVSRTVASLFPRVDNALLAHAARCRFFGFNAEAHEGAEGNQHKLNFGEDGDKPRELQAEGRVYLEIAEHLTTTNPQMLYERGLAAFANQKYDVALYELQNCAAAWRHLDFFGEYKCSDESQRLSEYQDCDEAPIRGLFSAIASAAVQTDRLDFAIRALVIAAKHEVSLRSTNGRVNLYRQLAWTLRRTGTCNALIIAALIEFEVPNTGVPHGQSNSEEDSSNMTSIKDLKLLWEQYWHAIDGHNSNVDLQSNALDDIILFAEEA
eukprot:Lankesteria_metandrocarpae@DN4370_c0_g1_i1.p1